MKYRLFDIAEVIRSKNSGPYELTFDVIFRDLDMFNRVADAGILNKKVFSEMYGINETDVLGVINFPPAKAIKITIVRPLCSGSLGETDVYGACQHAPLLNMEFEMEG